MKKENQSIIDLFQTLPLSSFIFRRSPISNKEAKTLYELWKNGTTDEYGKIIVNQSIDAIQIASLTSQGYVRNTPSRYTTGGTQLLEITNKGKDVIKKIILHNEKSAFNKESMDIDYESIIRSAELEKLKKDGKFASQQIKRIENNWFGRIIKQEINRSC